MSSTADAVSLPYWQDRDPLEALETAKLADALGYPELWIGEMATFDAFALATAVGLRTSVIQLTIGPLAVGVRDPMALAMGVASVAALTQCRVRLALGASSPTVVARWHGRPYDRVAARLRETVTAVRPLLAGEKAEFSGELVRTNGYRLRLPAVTAGVTVAAFGDLSIRVAARYGDRMVINLCTPDLAARLRRSLDVEAAGSGRRPRLAAWVVAALDPDEAALAQLTRGLVGYVAAPGYGEMFAAAGFGELVEFARSGGRPAEILARIPAELVAAVGCVGDEAACRRQLTAYRDAGVDEIVIVPATAGDPAGHRTMAALAP